jgi:hypothetical protein
MGKLSKAEQDALRSWRSTVNLVKSGKAAEAMETEADRQARVKYLLSDYNAFCQYYFEHYTTDLETGKQIKIGKFHYDLADKVEKNKRLRAVLAWSRDHAKSVHADFMLPLFRKAINPRELGLMVLVGETETTAKRLMQAIQAELQYNKRYIADFGKQVSYGDWSEGEFSTLDNCNFIALGLGQPVRGLRKQAVRPTWIVIDDIESLKKAKNQKRIREDVEWLRRTLIPTFSKGFSRLFVVNNLCVENGFIATVIKEFPTFWVQIVNALDAAGRVVWKERFDAKYFKLIREEIGLMAWLSEYMNQPRSDGGTFKREWEQWKMPFEDWSQYDKVVFSMDPSFSTSDTSDYTALRGWGFYKNEKVLLKSRVRQKDTLYKMLLWWHDFYFKLPKSQRLKVRNIIEGNGGQKQRVRDEYKKVLEKRKHVRMPWQWIEAKTAEKKDRIASIISDFEEGDVFFSKLEENDPDTIAGNAQLWAWNEGVNHGDDTPDADAQAFDYAKALKISNSESTAGKILNSLSQAISNRRGGFGGSRR